MDTAVASVTPPSGGNDDPVSRDDLELATSYVAPRTDIETHVADIWRRVLNLDRIGVQDDFFDLGGDSMNAAVIMFEVEHIFGLTFNMPVLLENSTIESFAGLIADDPAGAVSSVLFSLQAEGSKSPLFLVHGRLGHVFLPPAFTKSLDPDRPVYGFQARGLNGRDSPHSSVEAMAEDYVSAMRTVQPEGPYTLGSFCAGGHVAIEMARQLRSRGEELRPLILIDPPVVPMAVEGRIGRKISVARIHRILRRMSAKGIFFGKNGRSYFGSIFRHFFGLRRGARIGKNDESYERFAPEELAGAEQKRRYNWIAQKSVSIGERGEANFDSSTPEGLAAATWTSYQMVTALKQYQLRPFDGEVVAVLSEDRAIWAADPDYYLRALANDLQVHVVGTHHEEIFRERLPDLAEKINEILRDVS